MLAGIVAKEISHIPVSPRRTAGFSGAELLKAPGQLWVACKCETHKTAKECIGEHPRSMGGVASRETLENTEKSCAPRLAGDWH